MPSITYYIEISPSAVVDSMTREELIEFVTALDNPGPECERDIEFTRAMAEYFTRSLAELEKDHDNDA